MRHRFHSICPYFAMFPESFAERWIQRVTEPGDVILDPFCGRGTTPFQALLMRRRAVACDLNPVAFCVTRAKTNAPNSSNVLRRLTGLEREFKIKDWTIEIDELPEFFSVAFSRITLMQLLYLRKRLHWRTSETDCMISALILGKLHG